MSEKNINRIMYRVMNEYEISQLHKIIINKLLLSIDDSYFMIYSDDEIIDLLLVQLHKVIKKISNLTSKSPTVSKSNTTSTTTSKFDIHQMGRKELDNQFIKESRPERTQRKPDFGLTKPTTTNVIKSNQTKPLPLAYNVDKVYNLQFEKDLLRLINPSAGYVRYYVTFDSFNRDMNNSTNTFFQWQYVSTANPRVGAINSLYPIQNVIGMKIYQPIFPISAENSPNTYLTNRMSILVEEFTSQSFIASGGRNYHFMTRAVPHNSDNVFLDGQLSNFSDTYMFRKPITTFDTLSLSFGSPIELLTLPPDRGLCTFTYGGSTIVTTNVPIPTNYPYNVFVYFYNFTTANPAADQSVITAFNNPLGIQASANSANSFEVFIDTSAITPLPDLSIYCYFGSCRFVLSMEMICLQDASSGI